MIEWNSPIGLVMIGFIIYIGSILFANFASPYLNQIVNFEERLKKRIIQKKKLDMERQKKIKKIFT